MQKLGSILSLNLVISNRTLIHHSSDYPYLAVTDKYVYISMNLAKHEPFSEDLGPIVLRISLADLAAAISQSTTIGPRIDSYSDPSLPPSIHPNPIL